MCTKVSCIWPVGAGALKAVELILGVQWSEPREAGRSDARPVIRWIKVFWFGLLNVSTVTSVFGVSFDPAHLARSGGLLIQALTKPEPLF